MITEKVEQGKRKGNSQKAVEAETNDVNKIKKIQRVFRILNESTVAATKNMPKKNSKVHEGLNSKKKIEEFRQKSLAIAQRISDRKSSLTKLPPR